MRISYKINIQVYPDDTSEVMDVRIESALAIARTRLSSQFAAYLEDLKVPGETNF